MVELMLLTILILCMLGAVIVPALWVLIIYLLPAVNWEDATSDQTHRASLLTTNGEPFREP